MGTTMLTGEAGRDFAIHGERPDARELTWLLDRLHWPGPLSPLVFEVAGEPVAQGLMAAASTYDLPIAKVRIRRINGYRYESKVPLVCEAAAGEARRQRSEEKLRTAIGLLAESWNDRWLPEVKAHLEYWRTFNLPSVPLPTLLHHLDETMARVAHLWRIHFLLATPVHRATRGFTALHRELFGGSTLDALALLTGFDNETLRAGRGLWEMSRLARRTPAVREIVCGDPAQAVSTLKRSAAGRTFLVHLKAHLDRFGRRGEDLNFERPSWIEDPAPVIEHLKALVTQDERDLAAETAVIERQREQLVAEAGARLEGYPAPVREEFQFLLRAAQKATVLSEDHNWWIDARCLHEVRRVFLELGRRFAASGHFARLDDVFYLKVDELKEAAYVSAPERTRGIIAGRREEMQRFRSMIPPDVVGTRPTRGTPYAVGGAGSSRLNPLRGQPCSAGTARGTARVVSCLSEAGSLRRGDVLVTDSLSPSWTPLLATAAAVVAERGGVLSHGAVVAREYGIPAVLGAEAATSLIRDGQMVEVDGAAGTVSVIPKGWET